MRLAMFDRDGIPTLGVVTSRRPIEPVPRDRGTPASIEEVIAAGDTGSAYLRDLAEIGSPASRPIDPVRLLGPIPELMATGTPPGVRYFREPRRLLHDGDEVTVWVDATGGLRNPCAPIRRS